MTDITLYEEILTKANTSLAAIGSLDIYVQALDTNDVLDQQFQAIYDSFDVILGWTNQKILEANQEAVMTNFLAEMKVVFDKYTAKIEIGNPTEGYGTNWGGSSTATGMKLSATFGGLTATKEINKAVIVSGDLV